MVVSLLAIEPTLRLKTSMANRSFYDTIVDEKKLFATKYQLYTYAIMVAILRDAEPDTSVKNVDICQVVNANNEPANFVVAKGIVAHLCPEVTSGSELIKRMNEYADAGINILRSDYNNNDGELSLDSFID